MLLKTVIKSTRNSWTLNCLIGQNQTKFQILFHKTMGTVKSFRHRTLLEWFQLLVTKLVRENEEKNGKGKSLRLRQHNLVTAFPLLLSFFQVILLDCKGKWCRKIFSEKEVWWYMYFLSLQGFAKKDVNPYLSILMYLLSENNLFFKESQFQKYWILR